MASPTSSGRLLGVVLLVLGLSSMLVRPADAQDRNVPRFGPLVNPDTVIAGSFDFGRLWSFAQPPLDYLAEQYDVRANERGLRHARLGTVRLPDCSGALVSPAGLVLTAARCVQPHLPSVSDSLRESSFYAETPSAERQLTGLYAEQVVGVETVTAAVAAARSADGGKGERAAMERVEQQRQAETESNRRVEVVREAGGSRYVAYTYQRYTDVRLAFVPDRTVTRSGRLGAPLSYPQHAWDVAVLRIYENNQPLQTPQHLEVRSQGTRPGDAVFAVAHPSETQRAETHEQLAFRRDVLLPARRALLADETNRLRRYVDTARATTPWREHLQAATSAHRRATAQLETLRNEYVTARLRSRDQQLRRTMAAESSPTKEGEEIIDRLNAIQREKRALASDYQTFAFLMHPAHSSATLRRALLAYRVQAGDTAAGESIEDRLRAVPSQPLALDAAALADHLHHLRTHARDDSPMLRATPDPEAATSIVRGSVFADEQQTWTRIRQNDLPADDPALSLVAAVYDRYVSVRRAWDDLRAEERRLTDSLAQRRYQAATLPVTLPRDHALRIADGRIEGYSYNGTLAPPFTTFYGLYERSHALRATGGSDTLPRRWQSPSETFARPTPLTTVASTDLGPGAYGGPLLNTSLQLVGVVFDGNVQSAAGAYLFLPDRMRAVAVDVRGVLEGLSAVYEADRLVQEMTGEPASQ
jgi:hypothetical protein